MEIDVSSQIVSGPLPELRRLTSLAMAAAHNGLTSLTNADQQALFNWIGFDRRVLSELTEEAYTVGAWRFCPVCRRPATPIDFASDDDPGCTGCQRPWQGCDCGMDEQTTRLTAHDDPF